MKQLIDQTCFFFFFLNVHSSISYRL